MKFGRDLHRYRVPAWADSYVNYDRLKLLVRTGSEKGSFAMLLTLASALNPAYLKGIMLVDGRVPALTIF